MVDVIALIAIAQNPQDRGFAEATKMISSAVSSRDAEFFLALCSVLEIPDADPKLLFHVFTLLLHGYDPRVFSEFSRPLLDHARHHFASSCSELRMQAVEFFSLIIAEHLELSVDLELVTEFLSALETQSHSPLLVLSIVRALTNLFTSITVPEVQPHIFQLCVSAFSPRTDAALLREYFHLFGTIVPELSSLCSYDRACELIELILSFYGHPDLTIAGLHCLESILTSNPIFCHGIAVRLFPLADGDLQLYDQMFREGLPVENALALQNQVETVLIVWHQCASSQTDADWIPLWERLLPILFRLMQNVPVADPPSSQAWEPWSIAFGIIAAIQRRYPDWLFPQLFDFFTLFHASQSPASREAAVYAFALLFSKAPSILEVIDRESIIQFLLQRLQDTIRIRFATVACLKKLYRRAGPDWLTFAIEPLLAQIPVDYAVGLHSVELLLCVSRHPRFEIAGAFFETLQTAMHSFHPHSLPLVIRCFLFAVVHRVYALPAILFLLDWIAAACHDPEICDSVCGVIAVLTVGELAIRDTFAEKALSLLDFFMAQWFLPYALVLEAVLVNGDQKRMEARLPRLLERVAVVIHEHIDDSEVMKPIGQCLDALFLVYDPELFRITLGFATDIGRRSASPSARAAAIRAVAKAAADHESHLAIHLPALQAFVELIVLQSPQRVFGADEAAAAVEIMGASVGVIGEDIGERHAFVALWNAVVGSISDEVEDGDVAREAVAVAARIRQCCPAEMEDALTRSSGIYGLLHQRLAERAAAGKSGESR
jgi:hypothetical protein